MHRGACIKGGVRTLRDGLLPDDSTCAGVCLDFAELGVGEGRVSSDTVGCLFSWELGGSMASLLGTGVDSFRLMEADLAFGRKLALVVSFKQVEGSGETFDNGDEAGAGEDFWKKDMIDRCLPDAEAELFVTGFEGVRAAPAAPPAALSPAIFRKGQMKSVDRSIGWLKRHMRSLDRSAMMRLQIEQKTHEERLRGNEQD